MEQSEYEVQASKMENAQHQQFHEIHQDKQASLANLSAIAAPDRNPVTNLTTAVSKLTTQHFNSNIKLAAALAEVACLNWCPAPIDGKLPGISSTPGIKKKREFYPNGYCWSHGFKVNFGNSPNT